jgi:hypothetical protein
MLLRLRSGRTPSRALVVCVAVASLFAARTIAQSYSSGQPVWPAFEGWEKNADGTTSFVFGYMNDNWVEELNVPVGPENNIQPGGPDLGQPTHFQPRRNRFMFRVPVPKDLGDKEMVWTLTTQGKTQKAYASHRLDLLIENIDIMSETGALDAGFSNPELRGNKPPTVTVDGPKTRTAKVGEAVELSAVTTDDGIPRARYAASRTPTAVIRPPSRPVPGKSTGLHLSWFVYRGAGAVTFDPRQIKTWEDTRSGASSPWAPGWVAPPVPDGGKYVVHATFVEPGTYVLCARADDGGLTSDELVTVTVTR